MSSCDQHPLRVLLIEDEEDVARAILRGFARAGLSAAWANRGRTALALKNSFKPHVVLLDVVLPDMDGRSLVAMLGRPRDCGVVVLSGMVDEADKVIGGDFGADDFVAKPPHMRELIARVRAVHRRVNLFGRWARNTLGGQLEVEAWRQAEPAASGRLQSKQAGPMPTAAGAGAPRRCGQPGDGVL